MFRWLITSLQMLGFMAFSDRAFASGPPTAALFFPYIPILTYVICAVIWVLKSTLWSGIKRGILVIVVLPLFGMAAFFIPLLLVRQDKYFDQVFLLSSVTLTILIIGALWWSLTKKRQ